MQRNLKEFFTEKIAEKTGLIKIDGELNPLVTGLEYDSRCINQGNLFFALPGLHTDGKLYIDDAIKRGAVVIVHENDIENQKSEIVYIKVKNSRFAMSPISAAFYGFPSRRLLVTGVTGTEGKSTVVYLIWQLLRLLRKKTGFISTVQSCLGNEEIDNSEHQTTPEAPIIQKLLFEMAENGCEYAVIESSSHGLSQKTNRLGDVDFCSGVLTNITHEHLEFHGTWEQYQFDKANLFRAISRYVLPPELSSKYPGFTAPFGVVNGDDKSAQYVKELMKYKTFLYSSEKTGKLGTSNDAIIESIESESSGNSYMVNFPEMGQRFEIKDKLPGAYNSQNVLAAVLTVSSLLKLSVSEVAQQVINLKPVKGRMTTINKGQPFEVVVDYAHTPSSFQTIFPPLQQRIKKQGGRIISLFGSPGERDTQKRYKQGKIAASYSDLLFLTDEDPRGEDSMEIINEIARGCHDGKEGLVLDENLFLIPDRPTAIRKAFSLAKKGDLVILLGKAHENSIIYANYVMPFDEITEAEKALSEMNF